MAVLNKNSTDFHRRILIIGFGGSILDCHKCDSKDTVHPECWPITVPDGDPYFPKVNASTGLPFCLHFIRSLPGQLTLGNINRLFRVICLSLFFCQHYYSQNLLSPFPFNLLFLLFIFPLFSMQEFVSSSTKLRHTWMQVTHTARIHVKRKSCGRLWGAA